MASSIRKSVSEESGKMKSIEEEMSRFEEEIMSLTQDTASADGDHPPGTVAVPLTRSLPRAPGFQPRQMARHSSGMPPKSYRPPSNSNNRPSFVPHQLRVNQRPPGPPRFPNLLPPPPPPPMPPGGPMGPMPGMGPPPIHNMQGNQGPLPPPPMPPGMQNFPLMPPGPPMPPNFSGPGAHHPVTLSAKPTRYESKPVLFNKKKKEKKKNVDKKEKAVSHDQEAKPAQEAPPMTSVPLLSPPPPPPQMNISSPSSHVPPVAQQLFMPPAASSDLGQLTQGGAYELGSASEPLKKKDKKKRFVRTAAGMTWDDESLSEWDPNDFRLFAGDLGNEVTEDTLTKVFGSYPSYLKCKIVRDKRSNKTKGYGFVSFKDPRDFVQAMKDWNGKYVGNRPIKLLKSTWRDRDINSVKKKQKEKDRLGLR